MDSQYDNIYIHIQERRHKHRQQTAYTVVWMAMRPIRNAKPGGTIKQGQQWLRWLECMNAVLKPKGISNRETD